MSRRPRSTESPVSLFTFLDVLMCTMGALILLLIGLSMRMRSKASLEDLLAPAPSISQPASLPVIEEAVPAPAAPRYTVEDRERELAERATRHEQRRADMTAAVSAARAERDQEQKQLQERRRLIARAERKLQETRSRAERADGQSDAAQQAREAALAAERKLKGLEEQLVEQIEATRRNLDLENRKQATASNQYALVPYDGTSGTMRHPIYIECTKHGYRFIPENEFVGPEHLDGFSENYNPLLTGTQALLRYWNLRRRESGNQEPEPYVLLIVRPSGSLAYYLARKLLTPIGANFGYELVEEDWKLAAGEPDPQARAALRDAIEVTIETRGKIRESLAAAGGGRNAPFSVSNNHRAISRGELNSGFEPGPGRGASRGEAGGRSDGPDGRPPGSTDARQSAGGRNGPARAFADNSAPGFAGETDRPLNGAEGGLGAGGSRGRGTGRSPRAVAAGPNGAARAGNPGTGNGGLSAFGDSSDSTQPVREGDSFSGSAGARNASQRGRPGSPRPATFSGRDTDSPSDEESDGGGGRGRVPHRGPGPSGVAGDGGAEPPLVPLPDEVSPPRGHTPRALSASDPRPPGRLRTLEPDGDGGDGDSTEGERGGTQRGTRGTPSSRESGKSSGGSGAPGGGAVGEDSGGMITLGQSGGSSNNGEPAPPGGKRRWGKSPGRAGIGLERKLEIHAKADRLLIGPNDAAIPVGQGEKSEELLQRVLQGIEQTAHTWGPPPANFYWLPAVKFVVYPGGNAYYERLRGPLEKLGVTSTVQYAAATTSVKGAGGARP